MNTLEKKQKEIEGLEDKYGKSMRNRTKNQMYEKEERKLERPLKRCKIQIV